jgi:hypothetical protein
MADDSAETDLGGTITVPAFALSVSSFLSAEDRNVLVRSRAADELNIALSSCLASTGSDLSDAADTAACQASAVYETDQYRRLREKYPVTISLEKIEGVPVEIFQRPAELASEMLAVFSLIFTAVDLCGARDGRVISIPCLLRPWRKSK